MNVDFSKQNYVKSDSQSKLKLKILDALLLVSCVSIQTSSYMFAMTC
jgi:hypothetical protein